MVALEHVLQGKLDQARIHRSVGDLAEHAADQISATGIAELWMVESVEELRAELQRRLFVDTANFGLLDEGEVPIVLPRPQNDTRSRIPGARSV